MKKKSNTEKPDRKKLITAIIVAALVVAGAVTAIVFAVRGAGPGGDNPPATYSDVPRELIDELLRENGGGD